MSIGHNEMSIGHTGMSIRPPDKQKCPLDIQMSIYLTSVFSYNLNFTSGAAVLNYSGNVIAIRYNYHVNWEYSHRHTGTFFAGGGLA